MRCADLFPPSIVSKWLESGTNVQPVAPPCRLRAFVDAVRLPGLRAVPMTATGLALASKRRDDKPAFADPCKVFLYGYFGFGNTGDTLLLHAATAAIARRWPDARFVVRNLGPVPLPEHLVGHVVLSNVDRVLDPAASGAPRGRMRRAFSYMRAVAAAMSGCRVFVLAGGTLLHVRRSYVPLVLMLLLVATARLKGL